MTSTPVELGFHMPAEWEPHRRCWMAWPCRDELWKEHLEEAKEATAAVACAIADFEQVVMLVHPRHLKDPKLPQHPNVHFKRMIMDDSWIRDTGPTFLVNRVKGVTGGVDWTYNAWGNKYNPFLDDGKLARNIMTMGQIPCTNGPLVLEGGAVHVDGEGTIMTTESVVLNVNRNKGVSQEEVSRILRNYLGGKTVIWLPGGLEGDETDGHVDKVACFAKPGVVIMQGCRLPTDDNYKRLRQIKDILHYSADAEGRALTVVELPMPPIEHNRKGRRLPLSYASLYIANGGVVMPSFDCPDIDEEAFGIIQTVFDDRKVVQVPAKILALGGGGIHSITCQQPEPPAPRA